MSGVSELSDVSVPASEERQYTSAKSSILQQQQPTPAGPSMQLGAPQLVQAFHDQRVRQGDSVTFTCQIAGTPKPKVSRRTSKLHVM